MTGKTLMCHGGKEGSRVGIAVWIEKNIVIATRIQRRDQIVGGRTGLPPLWRNFMDGDGNIFTSRKVILYRIL